MHPCLAVVCPAASAARSRYQFQRTYAAGVGRYGDGWIVASDYLAGPPDDAARQMLDWLRDEEAAAGRPMGSLGVQGVCTIGQRTEAECAERAEAWRQFGATDLLVDTGVSARASDASLNTPAAQLKALRRIYEVLADRPESGV